MRGRYVRVQLLGLNNLNNGVLSLAEARVLTFDEANLATSDADIRRGTDWWEASFAVRINVGEIELENVDSDAFGELSNFKVSVWDQEPAAGGRVVWEKDYFASGSVGRGGVFRISGDEVGVDGSTRLASTLGGVVRVELNGLNNAGTSNLTLAAVSVRDGVAAPPKQNVALRGVAKQSSNHYSNRAFAEVGINGIVNPSGDLAIPIRAADAWWQVDLQQVRTIDQLAVFVSPVTGNFRVSVWDGDPEGGAAELWGRNYYKGSADFDEPGMLRIDGSVTSGGVRLDAVSGALVVRVQMIQYEQFGVSEVQVWDSSAPPVPVDGAVYVQAEDYETWHDTTAGSSGRVYRGDDVDIEARDGGYSIGWVDDGEWLTYPVDLMPGTYDFSARLAAIAGGRTLTATLDGVPVAAIPVPITGSWAAFQTVTVSNLTVTAAGAHQLRLDLASGGFNLNWVAFSPVGGDGDADQMRDDWEVDRFGDLAEDPGPDSDADGFSNLMEYYADTDPTDSNSWFYAGIVPGTSGDVELSWVQSRERLYDIFRADDLTGSFTQLVSGIEFPQTNFVDGAGLNHAFYQIQVRVR